MALKRRTAADAQDGKDDDAADKQPSEGVTVGPLGHGAVDDYGERVDAIQEEVDAKAEAAVEQAEADTAAGLTDGGTDDYGKRVDEIQESADEAAREELAEETAEAIAAVEDGVKSTSYVIITGDQVGPYAKDSVVHVSAFPAGVEDLRKLGVVAYHKPADPKDPSIYQAPENRAILPPGVPPSAHMSNAPWGTASAHDILGVRKEE